MYGLDRNLPMQLFLCLINLQYTSIRKIVLGSTPQSQVPCSNTCLNLFEFLCMLVCVGARQTHAIAKCLHACMRQLFCMSSPLYLHTCLNCFACNIQRNLYARIKCGANMRQSLWVSVPFIAHIEGAKKSISQSSTLSTTDCLT